MKRALSARLRGAPWVGALAALALTACGERILLGSREETAPGPVLPTPDFVEESPSSPCQDAFCGAPCVIETCVGDPCTSIEISGWCDWLGACTESPEPCASPCAYSDCGDPCSNCAPDDPACLEAEPQSTCNGYLECEVGSHTCGLVLEPSPCDDAPSCGTSCTFCDPADEECVEPEGGSACDETSRCVPLSELVCAPDPACDGKACLEPCDACAPDNFGCACDGFGQCLSTTFSCP